MLTDISISGLLIVLVTMLVSLTLHEAMHGFIAHALGDDTAKMEGRLTLNPLQHIDIVTTVLLPVLLIALHLPPIFIAKPVPFNPNRVKWEEFGAALVGLAGPFTNLVLAVVASLIFRIVGGDIYFNGEPVLQIFMIINIALFVFNMIPVPPLDGSRLVYAFAPEPVQRVMQQIEAAGMMVTIVIFLLLAPIVVPFVSDISNAIFSFLLR
jgi:Zn-dependent protease